MSDKISESKIVLTTHSLIYSASQALRDYLRENKCSFLLYIAHPLPLKGEKSEEKSSCEISKKRKIIKQTFVKLKFQNLALSTFYEIYLTLKWVINTGEFFDIYIGVDNLNAFQGLILKRLGKVKKVVYYTIDYFPTRFENKLLNWLYYKIDKVCVRYCDETWNVSSAMAEVREKHHQMERRVYNRQYTVPIGIWYDKAPRKKYSQIDKKKIIFVGHLLPHMGVDLVIESLPEIARHIPGVKLEVIGGGEIEESLRELAKKMKVEKRIKFYGWIKDRKRLENIMSDGAIGVATFNTEILDDKVKNADPAKIKDYLLLGMPVIVTDAISKTRIEGIKKSQCGYVIKYKKKELVEAVVRLLKDEELLKKYRENALSYIRQFDYDEIFTKHLVRVLD